jgi:hypothetical protein
MAPTMGDGSDDGRWRLGRVRRQWEVGERTSRRETSVGTIKGRDNETTHRKSLRVLRNRRVSRVDETSRRGARRRDGMTGHDGEDVGLVVSER